MARLLPLLLLVLLAAPGLRAQAPAGDELLPAAAGDRSRPATNPWKGFNKDRAMFGPVEKYFVVDDAGRLTWTPFPVALDAADFLKRGLNDIVMLDGQGYLRYFPNTGTKEAPKFAEAIVLPVQLGFSPFQIQAVDYDGDGYPDLVLGDDDGYLYMLRNQGGSEAPRFDHPKKPEQVRVDVAGGGEPWCNYLSPAYARWRPGANGLDLILGDGTYAADNVYFLRNKGSSERPKFDGHALLIPGEGRQHLTVKPWYGASKDKPDLLVGERNGGVTLYANDTAENDPAPKFKPGRPLAAGGAAFAPLGRLAAADLNGDGKPDLLWSDAQGVVRFALNTGTADAPAFGAGAPLTCPDAPKPYAVPTGWSNRSTFFNQGDRSQTGGFFFFLHSVGTNPQDPATYEPGLTMPEGPDKCAIKFEFFDPPKQVTAPYPPFVDDQGNEGVYRIYYSETGERATGLKLKEKTPYKLSFQVKGDGFSKFCVRLRGVQRLTVKQGGREVYNWKEIGFEKEVSLGSSWQKFEYVHTFQFDKDADEYGKGNPANFVLFFWCSGKGTFYLSDFSLKQVAK